MSLFGTESIASKSDFGRMFGWWVNIEDQRVASLEYRFWDSNSQFWHVYEVCKLSQDFDALGFESENWCDPSVTIQSRFATAFVQNGVLVSERENNLLAVRDLYVPKGFLNQAEKRIMRDCTN